MHETTGSTLRKWRPEIAYGVLWVILRGLQPRVARRGGA